MKAKNIPVLILAASILTTAAWAKDTPTALAANATAPSSTPKQIISVTPALDPAALNRAGVDPRLAISPAEPAENNFAITYQAGAGRARTERERELPDLASFVPGNDSRVVFAMTPVATSFDQPNGPVNWYPSVSFRF